MSASVSESPRCRTSSILLMAKHGEGGHSVPNMKHMTDGSCDYPYRPLLTPCSYDGSIRSLNTTPPIPIITTSHENDSPTAEDCGSHGPIRVIRQRSNPENKSDKSRISPTPSLSPKFRRKSYIPGVGNDAFASVVADSLKLNGTIGQLKQVS